MLECYGIEVGGKMLVLGSKKWINVEMNFVCASDKSSLKIQQLGLKYVLKDNL